MVEASLYQLASFYPMILIISTGEDLSTDFVLEWLYRLGGNFCRVNFFELLLPDSRSNNIFYSLNENRLRINSKTIDLDSVNAVWLRKLGTYKKSSYYKSSVGLVRFDLLAKNSTEFGAFVMSVLKNINQEAYWITNLKHVGQSKWQVLKKAREVGLKVPETYFINQKFDLEKIRQKEAIINKTIQEPYFIDKGRHYFSMYTTDICNEDVKNLPERFMLSCVQTKIEKEYEVRSFFLDSDFFSMAIFSQNDPKTRLDFRNYNTVKPNRVVPYKLPDHIEEKLKTLMRSIDLNCGSIDLIRDKNGEYVFLEVNPNGQYGMVDHPCNYNLNKLIAEKLIYEDQKRQISPYSNKGTERKASSALSISTKEQEEIHSIRRKAHSKPIL